MEHIRDFPLLFSEMRKHGKNWIQTADGGQLIVFVSCAFPYATLHVKVQLSSQGDAIKFLKSSIFMSVF